MKNIPAQIIGRFLERTPQSQALTERARRVMPGGDTRAGVYYAPYPAYMVAGAGSQVVDADGNHYVDFLNNYTSLVHGHGHPALVEAANRQMPAGYAYASPMTGQIELAEIICDRVPGIEQLRFTNSGTEATMLAVRAARAYTGRSGILKLHGSYHGSHDLAAATADPEADRGIPAGLRQDLYFASYNDLAGVASILADHAPAIAAILLEPVPNAGGIPLPKPGYLQGLRTLADRFGVLLIFDEVVTLRLDRGGYQRLAGVTPDLTALGKIIGGGFAVGAFGGRREIMANFDPAHKQHVSHSGTFNGHAVTMAAGKASLLALDDATIAHINGLGGRLAAGFTDAFAEAGIAGSTTCAGSLVQVHWRTGPIETMEDVAAGFAGAGDLPYLVHLALMNRGLFAAARGEYNLSSVMGEADVSRAIALFSDTLQALKPYVAERYPALLSR